MVPNSGAAMHARYALRLAPAAITRVMRDCSAMNSERIDLRSPLSLRNSLRFPLQSPASRRDLGIGALWLLVPVVGWLMNMGHRVRVVHRLQRGETPWPAWEDPRELLRHGAITFAGMVWYGWPGVFLSALGVWIRAPWLTVVGAALWALAVVAIPGFMSHYCRRYDPREIFDPRRALRRVFEGGVPYLRAWAVALVAMALSFVGLCALGVGFLFTSVWFWQAAAFSFGTVFTRRFDLDAAD
jgi:hypothetical protein